MRSFLLFLAFTLVVATVSAEDSVLARVVKRFKTIKEAAKQFFAEDPLGKRIVKFFTDTMEIVPEGRSKIREKLAKYVKELKAEAQ